jgi:hypothetical protein
MPRPDFLEVVRLDTEEFGAIFKELKARHDAQHQALRGTAPDEQVARATVDYTLQPTGGGDPTTLVFTLGGTASARESNSEVECIVLGTSDSRYVMVFRTYKGVGYRVVWECIRAERGNVTLLSKQPGSRKYFCRVAGDEIAANPASQDGP